VWHWTVTVDGPDDRSDDRGPVHHPGEPGEDLADPDAGHVGVDRPELAADLDGGLGLEVPQVLVRRPAPEEDIDDRLVPGPGLLSRLGPQDFRQGQHAARHQPADPEKSAAGDPVAVAALPTPDRQHGEAPRVMVDDPPRLRSEPTSASALQGRGYKDNLLLGENPRYDAINQYRGAAQRLCEEGLRIGMPIRARRDAREHMVP
jgi:hypothetical protein